MSGHAVATMFAGLAVIMSMVTSAAPFDLESGKAENVFTDEELSLDKPFGSRFHLFVLHIRTSLMMCTEEGGPSYTAIICTVQNCSPPPPPQVALHLTTFRPCVLICKCLWECPSGVPLARILTAFGQGEGCTRGQREGLPQSPVGASLSFVGGCVRTVIPPSLF